MINLIESMTARGLLYVVNSRDAKRFGFAGEQKLVSICFGTRDTAAADSTSTRGTRTDKRSARPTSATPGRFPIFTQSPS